MADPAAYEGEDEADTAESCSYNEQVECGTAGQLMLDALVKVSACAWCEAIRHGDAATLAGLIRSPELLLPPCAPFTAIECCEPRMLEQLTERSPASVLVFARDPRGFTVFHAAADEEADACMDVLVSGLLRRVLPDSDGNACLPGSTLAFGSCPCTPSVTASVRAVVNARVHRCPCDSYVPGRSHCLQRWHVLAPPERGQRGSGSSTCGVHNLNGYSPAWAQCRCECHPALTSTTQQQQQQPHPHRAPSASAAAAAAAAPTATLTPATRYLPGHAPPSVHSVFRWCAGGPSAGSSVAMLSALQKRLLAGYSESAARGDARRLGETNETRAQAWRTPLHHALHRRSVGSVAALRRAGADPHMPPKAHRRSPADEASRCMLQHVRAPVEGGCDGVQAGTPAATGSTGSRQGWPRTRRKSRDVEDGER